ncbi:MAG: archease [bacterium]|nr:archease [bacterium]
MKKIKIINHTADIGIEVYGKTIEEIFENSLNGLYRIIGVKSNGYEKEIEINVCADEIEGLLVKFLNELIYYIETQKIAGKIIKIKIDSKENRYNLYAKLKMGKIEKITKEVKATTYHNLKLEKINDGYKTSIIFDL